MRRAALFLVLVAAAACGDPAAAPNCETALRRAADRLPAAERPTDDVLALLVGTCIEQKWPDAVRTCLAGAATAAQAEACVAPTRSAVPPPSSRDRVAELKAQLDSLVTELARLDTEMKEAEAALAAARTEAERDAAKARIDLVRRQQRIAQERLDKLKAGVKLKCPPDQPLC